MWYVGRSQFAKRPLDPSSIPETLSICFSMFDTRSFMGPSEFVTSMTEEYPPVMLAHPMQTALDDWFVIIDRSRVCRTSDLSRILITEALPQPVMSSVCFPFYHSMIKIFVYATYCCQIQYFYLWRSKYCKLFQWSFYKHICLPRQNSFW